jgi:hypothetical protein
MSETSSTSETCWYYQDGWVHVGPVDATLIRDRIRQGKIRQGTLLRKDGASSWTAVQDTEFAGTLTFVSAGLKASDRSGDTWPVSAAPAWLIAVAPVPLTLLPIPGLLANVVGTVVYVCLALWDTSTIRASGRTPSKAYLWAILLGGLGAPIYLYLRGDQTDGKRGYFFPKLNLDHCFSYCCVFNAMNGHQHIPIMSGTNLTPPLRLNTA